MGLAGPVQVPDVRLLCMICPTVRTCSLHSNLPELILVGTCYLEYLILHCQRQVRRRPESGPTAEDSYLLGHTSQNHAQRHRNPRPNLRSIGKPRLPMCPSATR